MKFPLVLLLTGAILMAAAFAVPKLFGGRAALHGELERELATSGELHMATAHSHDASESVEGWPRPGHWPLTIRSRYARIKA